MKIPILFRISTEIQRIWYSFWIALLFVFLTGGVAIAAPVNLPPTPNPNYTINATVGIAVAGENITTNAGGNVIWDFVTPPVGCGAGPTTYNCNGITITLPAGSPGVAVPNTAVTTVSGIPTAPGFFTFRLIVAPEDGSTPGERTFELDITSPSVSSDISFVLDRSGSMSESLSTTPPATTRWEALKNGVNGFTPFIQSTLPGGSRFGLTLFATNILTNTSIPPTATNPANLITINNNLATNVNTELNSQTPSGSTAMGSGLKTGITKMTDASRPRVVVLFTDGEQNQDPKVNLNGQGYNDGTSVNASYPAGPGSVKIVTVGVGAPASDYLTTLQNLATQNRGNSIFTSNGVDFGLPGICTGDVEAAFDCAIAPALSTNSPLMVGVYTGTLSDTPATLPAFDINHNLKQLLIKLSFSNSFQSSDLQKLLAGIRISKDGRDITPYFRPVIVGSRTNTIILRTAYRPSKKTRVRITSEGHYEIQLTKPEGLDDLQYRVIPYADDTRLDVTWGINPALPRVNQTFQPTVNLSWRGVPLTDATVEATIFQPGDDVGDLLARNPLVVKTNPDQRRVISPGREKYQHLLRNDREFVQQLFPKQNQLTLTHQGKGTYTANFNPTDISGIYQIYYYVQAKDPDTGSLIQRLLVESVYVRFGPINVNASLVSTTIQDNNTVVVNWRPVTREGRFIGPDQINALSVDGMKLVDVQDNQDGSYTLTLSGTSTSPVVIRMLGEKIYQGPINRFGQRRSSFPRVDRSPPAIKQ